MTNHFQITALMAEEFLAVQNFDERQLNEIGALRMTANKTGKFPCRVSLEEALPGEEVILLNYQHHQTNSPYRASGPIFIRQGVKAAHLNIDEIPEFLERRYLSLRCYSNAGMMNEAFTAEGKEIRSMLEKAFRNHDTGYIHIHNARHGCYLCAAHKVQY